MVTEPLYLEYSSIPREQQTIKQFVSCRVYDMMRIERGHRDAAVVECVATREQLVRAESEMERLRMEKEQVIRNKRASALTPSTST
jgi:hypothetical protein